MYALTDENKAIFLLLLKLVRFISGGSSVGKRIYDVTLYYIILGTEIHHVTRRNARHWRKLGHVTSLSYNSSGDNVTSHDTMWRLVLAWKLDYVINLCLTSGNEEDNVTSYILLLWKSADKLSRIFLFNIVRW